MVKDGTRNPHRSEVAKDIRDSIMIKPANKDGCAKYWTKEEQAVKLAAAYNKWSKVGTVWSAAAYKVNIFVILKTSPKQTDFLQTHLDQMGHVTKGCLARSRQDIPTDGSRIEGSHKGWNSLQRSFASGIVMTDALSHDFVLRRNCRIACENKDATLFSKSTYGSHHVQLVSSIAERWNEVVELAGAHSVLLLPFLPKVDSGEQFGLVESEYATSFKGLIEMKEEVKEEDAVDLSTLDEMDEFSDTLKGLNIDPDLLQLPERHPSKVFAPLPANRNPTLVNASNTNRDAPIIVPNSPSPPPTENNLDLPQHLPSKTNTDNTEGPEPRGKRKAIDVLEVESTRRHGPVHDLGSDTPDVNHDGPLAKRARIDSAVTVR